MNRWLLTLTVLLGTGLAWGQMTGGRGPRMSPAAVFRAGLVRNVPWDQLPTTAPAGRPQKLDALVAPLVLDLEKLLRQGAEAAATDLQVEDLLRSKLDRMDAAAAKLLGKHVMVDITVRDVMRREGREETVRGPRVVDPGGVVIGPPVEWKPTREYNLFTLPKASDPELVEAPYAVAGRLDWRAPMAATADEEVRFRALTEEYQKRIRDVETSGVRLADRPRALAEIKASYEAQFRHLRDPLEAKRPFHEVLVVGADPALPHWRKGERRQLVGVIQEVLVLPVEVEDARGSAARHAQVCVRMRMVSPAAAVPGRAGPPATRPADGKGKPAVSPEREAKAMLNMAEMYRDAGRKDLALKVFREIIDKFPDTKAARTAAAAIASLK